MRPMVGDPRRRCFSCCRRRLPIVLSPLAPARKEHQPDHEIDRLARGRECRQMSIDAESLLELALDFAPIVVALFLVGIVAIAIW
jgi:hypothetical protein